jgi:hypothetical protein
VSLVAHLWSFVQWWCSGLHCLPFLDLCIKHRPCCPVQSRERERGRGIRVNKSRLRPGILQGPLARTSSVIVRHEECKGPEGGGGGFRLTGLQPAPPTSTPVVLDVQTKGCCLNSVIHPSPPPHPNHPLW